MRRDGVAGSDPGVEANALALGRFELQQGAGLGCETVGWGFGVQPDFDGMAVQLDLVLGQWQRAAFSDSQLPGHQVLAGDQFGDRVFHLQAGVHFQEVEIAVLVHQELDCTCALVTTSQRGSHGGFAHG